MISWAQQSQRDDSNYKCVGSESVLNYKCTTSVLLSTRWEEMYVFVIL